MKYGLALAFLITVQTIALASDKERQDARELLEKAEAAADILQLTAFELKASVKLENQGKPIAGSYLFLWKGSDQWREEVALPSYTQVTVGAKGVVFQKRSTDFLPLQISQLQGLMSYGRRLLPGPKETILRVHGHKINGIKVDCVEIADPEHNSREICVDLSTNALVRESPFVDRDLAAVGSKLFPRSLTYVEHGKSIVLAEVTELKTTDAFPSSAFDPPPGALSKPGCINPDRGWVDRKVPPIYPPQERMAHREGTVSVYAVIGSDGTLHDLRIVSGASPALDRSTLDAMLQWRYEPYTCNGVPVEVESILVTNYRLQ